MIGTAASLSRGAAVQEFSRLAASSDTRPLRWCSETKKANTGAVSLCLLHELVRGQVCEMAAADLNALGRLTVWSTGSGLVLDEPIYQPVDLAGSFHMRQVSGLVQNVDGQA